MFVPEPITYALGSIASWIAEKVLVVPENETEQAYKEEVIPAMPRKALADGEEIELAM